VAGLGSHGLWVLVEWQFSGLAALWCVVAGPAPTPRDASRLGERLGELLQRHRVEALALAGTRRDRPRLHLLVAANEHVRDFLQLRAPNLCAELISRQVCIHAETALPEGLLDLAPPRVLLLGDRDDA